MIIKLLVSVSLEMKIVNILWDELVNKKRISLECLTMCRWVQELAKEDRIDCEEFFVANFVQNKTNPKCVTEEAFECFQEIMLKVNVKKGLITKLNLTQASNLIVK